MRNDYILKPLFMKLPNFKFFKIKLNALFALALISSFYSCVDGWGRGEPIVYTEFTPILITRGSLESSVSLKPVTNIGDAAKIYYKDNFIFISERFKGIHIIDNTNPANPINKGYIAIPGCVDMAIKNDILYVDNAIDLIAINLTDAQKGTLNVVKRIANVFPEVTPPDGGIVPAKYSTTNRPKNTFIIGWKK